MDKVTIHTLKRLKQAGQKISMVTAYDATFARILDEAGADVLLVGDSLGMVIQGNESTLPGHHGPDGLPLPCGEPRSEAGARRGRSALPELPGLGVGGGEERRPAAGRGRGEQREARGRRRVRRDHRGHRPRGHPGHGPPRPHPAVGAPDGRLRGAGARRGAGEGHLPRRPGAGAGGLLRAGARGHPARAGAGHHRLAAHPHHRHRRRRPLRWPGAGLLRPLRLQPRLQAQVREALRRWLWRAARGGRDVLRRGEERRLSGRRALVHQQDAARAAGPAARVVSGRRPSRRRSARSTASRSDARRPHPGRAHRVDGDGAPPGPPGGPRADHGVPAPGPSEPDGGLPGARRRHRGEHLRQPDAVRPRRGPGALPPRPRGGSGEVPGGEGGHGVRAGGGRHVSARPPDVRRGDGAPGRALRRAPTRALPRRGDRRHPAVRARPAARGGVR